MRVICAYLLAVLGGNASPTAKDIETILGAVGVEADSDRVEKLLSELEGKDLAEVLAEGKGKLASVPAGGAVAAPAGGADGAPAAAAEAAAEEEEEEEEEEMGFDLFD
mmetsp:Transcript_235/g.1864  ORF Transcript_235/g.1864 Transcript_235/m.1864 type:complete len:108 (-) Transcript_235:4037-4360(-)|eukprot:CAMPEP_0113927034 /NCGR_PEP_ID=MMETSP1159-20121227/4081_1 /TAXON_ID=88271 /ORGANISM="Picocystis salinarum" /LENGTH=107 /DNA_ID=CAMNT_0000927483 /DNA_START=65 /DNA_END=388 /DNA_ORIENTATION=- /assembly_acc=CAM_ASM_000767